MNSREHLIYKITGFLVFFLILYVFGEILMVNVYVRNDFVKRDQHESAKENDSIAIAFLFESFFVDPISKRKKRSGYGRLKERIYPLCSL